MTIREAIIEAVQRLTAAGIDAPRPTAHILLAHALERDRTYSLTHPDETLEGPALDQFRALVEKRADGVPVQYLTNHQEFYGLDFVVSPEVFIPRPETELIVDEVLALNRKEDPLIIDVGTGSGCLAVTLAAQLPGSRLIALDLSESALKVAQINARRHDVEQRVWFLVGDLLSPLLPGAAGRRADFIVANPPYISEIEFDALHREVRDYEPRIALLAGEDGLAIHRRLLSECPPFLRPDGALMVEMGFGQYPALRKLIASSVWREERVVPDLQGIERILVLRLTTEG